MKPGGVLLEEQGTRKQKDGATRHPHRRQGDDAGGEADMVRDYSEYPRGKRSGSVAEEEKDGGGNRIESGRDDVVEHREEAGVEEAPEESESGKGGADDRKGSGNRSRWMISSTLLRSAAMLRRYLNCFLNPKRLSSGDMPPPRWNSLIPFSEAQQAIS